MNQLLEDIPIGLILDDQETDLLSADPPHRKTMDQEEEGVESLPEAGLNWIELDRTGALQVSRCSRCTNTSGEGGGSKGMTVGTLAIVSQSQTVSLETVWETSYRHFVLAPTRFQGVTSAC